MSRAGGRLPPRDPVTSPATDPRQGTGRRAEALAAAHLERLGFLIIARNWRRPGGELDLVADDQGICVFVEVRARTGEDHGHPLEAISNHKRARVVRAARLYMAEEAPRATGYRFDVVGVLFPRAGAPDDEATCFHVANAFELDGG